MRATRIMFTTTQIKRVLRKGFLLFCMCLAFLSLKCKKDNPITPPEEIKPGRRDYVWTVDTLQIPQGDTFYPSRIWGSAPNDVWLTGFGSPVFNLLWHYNGVAWKKDSVGRQISPSALWGTASNNIWLGNSNNSFWRYNGTQWYKYCDITPSAGYDRVNINDIWGYSGNALWGVGGSDQFSTSDYKGVIMHFDGSQWKFLDIPSIRVGFSMIRKQQLTGILFVSGIRFESTGDTSKVFIFDGANIKQIYSDLNHVVISELNGEVYFVIQHKIYKYLNDSFQLWKDFGATTYGGAMLGRSEIDFLGIQQGGGIVHFNGTDMVSLYNTTMQICGWYIFEKDVFFIFQDQLSDVITSVHGVLP